MGKNKKRNANRRAQEHKQADAEQHQANSNTEEVTKPIVPEINLGVTQAANPEPMQNEKALEDIPETPRKIEDTIADSQECVEQEKDLQTEEHTPSSQQADPEAETEAVHEELQCNTEASTHPTVSLKEDDKQVLADKITESEDAAQRTLSHTQEKSLVKPENEPAIISEPSLTALESVTPEPEPETTPAVEPQPVPEPAPPTETPTQAPPQLEQAPVEATPPQTETTSAVPLNAEPQHEHTPDPEHLPKEVRLEVNSESTQSQPLPEPSVEVAQLPETMIKHEHCVTIENTRGSLDYSSKETTGVISAVQGTNNAIHNLLDSVVPRPLTARPKKQSRICCSMQ